jgi:hypothetical protein
MPSAMPHAGTPPDLGTEVFCCWCTIRVLNNAHGVNWREEMRVPGSKERVTPL